MTTSDPDTIEETPGKPTSRQETDKFTPPTLTSSPITSPTMSHHHTLHPTPGSGPPCPTSIKTPSNRKVLFTPVLTVYGAGASKPSQVQASTFFETYEKELTRLLEAGVDTKTAVSTARTLAQAEQNQPTATADTLQGTINPYPTSTLQGVTPLPVPQWGYDTPPTNPFAPSGQPSRALPTQRTQQEQAMQDFGSVTMFCDRQRSGRFDDWAAHLESALDLGNFEETRKLRLMRSKLYGEAAEEFDTFKLDNSIRSQEYAAVKARLFKLLHSTETRSQRSVEFHNMKREPEKNMRRYANRIRKAFHKAYPMDGILDSATVASREQMMMDRFLRGLPSDVQVPLRSKKFASLRKQLLNEYHDSPLSGHLAHQWTWLRIRDKYYWPTKLSDVKEYCLACKPCALQRRSNLRAFLNPLDLTSGSFEVLGLDFIGPIQPQSLQGNNHILVITDNFTKWVEVILLADQTALSTSKVLADSHFVSWSPKGHCHRPWFEFFFRAVLLTLFNKTVVEMLRKYMEQGFSKWEEVLDPVAFAYRNSVHSSTLETPNFLNHGRDPVVSIDRFLQKPENIIVPSDYKSQLMQRLHEAFLLVKANLAQAREQQRTQYDKRAREQAFNIGDKVLIDARTPMADTSKKLIPRFMGPYRVTKINNNHTVEIQKCAGKQTQLVHVNRIKLLYESMIWKEEPCVDFRESRDHSIPPELTNELEGPPPVDEEYALQEEQDLIDLDASPPPLPEGTITSNLHKGPNMNLSFTPERLFLTA
ncbi:Uncharacterized protein APZ42_013448 [Daphnia magna]|uniref:Uncharacterized protein n=1 Tax=Daphnia magna TaxID=35525 RepID=A0A162QVF7_9CRUS|nr:Uncharacterized protein APZ42_013448 [Daphnia magna]